MLSMKKKLDELSENGRDIKIGIVGIGKMGRGLVNQLSYIKGIKPSLLINRTPEKAIEALKASGIDKDNIIYTNSIEKINENINKNKYIVSEYSDLISKIENIDAIVDATGNPESGSNIAMHSINSNKNIIMLNVETDGAIGPILYEKAKEKNLIYTGTAGDEPGSAIELYEFAKNLGFEVLAIGKGKNNPLNKYITPDKLVEEAKEKGLRKEMLAGFIDGTNTMIELTTMANATGFLPDIKGAHGIKSDIDELKNILKLKSQGGILNNYKIVDYVLGIAPGVFAIFTTDSKELKEQLKYLNMGEGPNYVLYRPYHLTSMETPITIYEACVNKNSTIAPVKGQVADTIAVAKRDLKKGEFLDCLGGYTFYGTIESHENVRKNNYLPVGLIDEKTKIIRDIKKDEIISYDMVELDKNKTIYKLRKEQEMKK